MIRVAMELFPHGDRSRRSTLATVIIVNDGTGTLRRGNYVWRVAGRNDRTLKTGVVKNWPRLSKTPIALLQRVVNEAYPPTPHRAQKTPKRAPQ